MFLTMIFHLNNIQLMCLEKGKRGQEKKEVEVGCIWRMNTASSFVAIHRPLLDEDLFTTILF